MDRRLSVVGKSEYKVNERPLQVAYGMGNDSTAMLIGMKDRGVRPDSVLFADTGAERSRTYAYLNVMNEWLVSVGFPEITVVTYQPKNFKNYPAYGTLEENCLTNGTLPSLAFGFSSCSQKWKAQPQEKFNKTWPLAVAAWAQGEKVTKAIGYDSGTRDCERSGSFQTRPDAKYKYWFPLQEWGWDREACIAVIEKEGLPVPGKSSCFMCPAMKEWEVEELAIKEKDKLRRIVIMEARASVRLEGFMNQDQLDAINVVASGYDNEKDMVTDYEAAKLEYREAKKRWTIAKKAAKKSGQKDPRKPRKRRKVVNGRNVLDSKTRGRWKKVGDPMLIRGLWRGKLMTDFIVKRGLLPAEEVSMLWENAPKEILKGLSTFANGQEIRTWKEFFNDLDEDEKVPTFCST